MDKKVCNTVETAGSWDRSALLLGTQANPSFTLQYPASTMAASLHNVSSTRSIHNAHNVLQRHWRRSDAVNDITVWQKVWRTAYYKPESQDYGGEVQGFHPVDDKLGAARARLPASLIDIYLAVRRRIRHCFLKEAFNSQCK